MNAAHPKSTNPKPMLEDNNSSEEVRAPGQEPGYPHAFGKPPSPITDSDHSPPILNTFRSNAMQKLGTPKQIGITGADIKSLRLPSNYGATLGVKKMLTTVPVGKPKKPQFFRTHCSDEMTFPAMILEQKDTRETYVVVPDAAQQISELVRPMQMYAAIDRENNVFLIPVPLPGESGTRNQWHESLAQAVEHAKQKWLRISANTHIGGYDVYEAEGVLPEPEWPAHDIESLIEVAFRGKIITSLDHPIVQSLLGRI